MFTNEQLASSFRATVLYAPVLQATVLYAPVLQATTIMDLETLYSDIRSTLHSDPAISEELSNPTLRWTIDTTGLLCLDNRIYVPTPETYGYESYSTNMTTRSQDTLDITVPWI